MQPHHRTLNIWQTRMQPIPLGEVNRGHADPTSAVIAPVVLLDGATPKLAHILGTVLVETDVDQEIAVLGMRLEIRRRRRRRPPLDVGFQIGWPVPAAELARAFGFVV